MPLIQTVRRELLSPQGEREDIDSWRGHVLSIILLVTAVLGAVVAALLLGPWPALIALALNAATLLVVGYLANADIQLGLLALDPFLKWVVITLNFVFVNALLTLSIVLLLKGLEKTLARRNQAAEELRGLNATLEKRVAERTRELEAFSYSVAHDLRAPLRAIDGYSQLVLSDNADRLDAESTAYLKRMRLASQRLGEIIDDLLELAQVSRTELRKQEVDLAHMAAQVAAELRERHPGREVEFSAPAGLKAQADPFLARILFENLLGNAWKYTGKVSPARIAFGRSEADGRSAYFVRDNGAGFDMAYADKLFKPFQRLHDAGEFEGTGIGLSIVHRIVTRHEGRIWAEAQQGEGATFYFTLG